MTCSNVLLEKFIFSKWTVEYVYNILSKLKITRKKINKKKINGNREILQSKINDLKNIIKTIKMNDIISIDEVSFDTSISPDYGWADKGDRIYKNIKAVRTRYSVICAVSYNKIIAVKPIKGSANAQDFMDFIKNDLNLVHNKHLLLDNARIHHSKLVKKYMINNTNKLLFNVPYYPEFNPIEMVFSKVKYLVRNRPDNNKELLENIKKAFKKVTKNNLFNYFTHSLKMLKNS